MRWLKEMWKMFGARRMKPKVRKEHQPSLQQLAYESLKAKRRSERVLKENVNVRAALREILDVEDAAREAKE